MNKADTSHVFRCLSQSLRGCLLASLPTQGLSGSPADGLETGATSGSSALVLEPVLQILGVLVPTRTRAPSL